MVTAITVWRKISGSAADFNSPNRYVRIVDHFAVTIPCANMIRFADNTDWNTWTMQIKRWRAGLHAIRFEGKSFCPIDFDVIQVRLKMSNKIKSINPSEYNAWPCVCQQNNKNVLTMRQFRLDMASSSRKLFRKVVCRTSIKSMYPSHKWQYLEKPLGERGHAHDILAPFTMKNLPLIVFTKSWPAVSSAAGSAGFFMHSTWMSMWILLCVSCVSSFNSLLTRSTVSDDSKFFACSLLFSLHLSLEGSVVLFGITATGWLVCCVVGADCFLWFFMSDGVQTEQFSRHAGPLSGSFVDVGSINSEISPSYPRFRSNFLKPKRHRMNNNAN